MHEASIITSAIQIIEEKANENNISTISKVFFTIGELSGVSIDAFKFAFDSASKGTMMNGAQLIINIVEAKAKCNSCQIEFKIDRFNKFCPECEQFSFDIVSGRELFIDKVDGE